MTDDRRWRGQIERKVSAYAHHLRDAGDLDLLGEALAQTALRLARVLDAGPSKEDGTMAAVARELRATLAELGPKGGEPGDDDLFARLERELSSPMGDEPQP